MPCFSITTRIFFGKNACSELFVYLKGTGINKLIFIVDRNIKKLEALSRLSSDFERAGFMINRVAFVEAGSEPSYDLLDEFTEGLRGIDAEAIIAVGGGSVLDISKGVGILLKNPGRGIDYRGMDKVLSPGVPVICFPATAGTGSEVTHTASFIDTKEKTKLGINGRYVSPLCGVLLPELTCSCPLKVTISSGLDAMLHAIEAVTAKTASTVTRMLGSKAFAILFANFEKVIAAPDDYHAREAMLLGSYYAGVAMMNAGGGPASGISYPLGVYFNVPHGIAGGIFLPHVFGYNVAKGYLGYAAVYNELPGADLTLSDEDKSLEFVKQFCKLYKGIGAPERLSDWGRADIDARLVTKLTMEQRSANLALNPVTFGEEDVYKMLEKIV